MRLAIFNHRTSPDGVSVIYVPIAINPELVVSILPEDGGSTSFVETADGNAYSVDVAFAEAVARVTAAPGSKWPVEDFREVDETLLRDTPLFRAARALVDSFEDVKIGGDRMSLISGLAREVRNASAPNYIVRRA